jgi:hypothetical protein
VDFRLAQQIQRDWLLREQKNTNVARFQIEVFLFKAGGARRSEFDRCQERL